MEPDKHSFPVEGRPASEKVARPTRFGELIPAVGAVAVWVIFMLPQGLDIAIESVWLLLIGLLLGGWALLMRLYYSEEKVTMTLGPWKRSVALLNLKSISWKKTGGGRSRGTIYLRDRAGHVVPIYVGRFKGVSEWGPLIIRAADRDKVEVDQHSRAYLEGRMPDGAQVH